MTSPDEKDERIEKTIKVIIQRSEQNNTQKTDPAQIFFVADSSSAGLGAGAGELAGVGAGAGTGGTWGGVGIAAGEVGAGAGAAVSCGNRR